MKPIFYLLVVFALMQIPLSGYSQFYGAPLPYYGPTGNTIPLKTGRKTSVTLNSGNVQNLLGVKNINIIYDYSEVSVNAYRKESDFLEKRKDENKNHPDKVEKFRSAWFDSRQKYYEPAFEAAFNKQGKKNGIAGKNYAIDNSVTLKVATIYMAGKDSKESSFYPEYIDLECTFLDKNGVELLRYVLKNVNGDNDDSDIYTSSKNLFLSNYSKAAKILMKDISKGLKKIK